jgi:ubiquinone/menaquinone biosynthesis C-methylase UbiE
MPNLHPAFRTWNDSNESLESVERRIHDGVPITQLRDRAQGYVNLMYELYPQAEPGRGDTVCEIGSGVGYVMEAVQDRCHQKATIGLDVAPAMLYHAAERFQRDKVDSAGMHLVPYDGVTIPFRDHSIDHIYSVACLQHVPKLYVYHLFGELVRVLRGGWAVLQFLSFSHIPTQNKIGWHFDREVERQLAGEPGHWHHFYSADELVAVLGDGYGASAVSIRQKRTSIWAAFQTRR